MKKMLLSMVSVVALTLGFASACPECIDPRIGHVVSPTTTTAAPLTFAPVAAPQAGTLVLASQVTPAAPVAVPAVKAGFDWSTLLGPLLPTLITLLTAALTAASAAGFSFLRNRTKLIKIEAVQKVLDSLYPILFSKVKAIFDESTALLKAASADGKLTPLEARAALLTAVEDAWKGFPAIFISTLLTAYGSEGAAKAAIADKVGNVLSEVKSQATVSGISPFSLGSASNPGVITSTSTPTPSTIAVAAARARIGLR
jgi:hypothetical protein